MYSRCVCRCRVVSWLQGRPAKLTDVASGGAFDDAPSTPWARVRRVAHPTSTRRRSSAALLATLAAQYRLVRCLRPPQAVQALARCAVTRVRDSRGPAPQAHRAGTPLQPPNPQVRNRRPVLRTGYAHCPPCLAQAIDLLAVFWCCQQLLSGRDTGRSTARPRHSSRTYCIALLYACQWLTHSHQTTTCWCTESARRS